MAGLARLWPGLVAVALLLAAAGGTLLALSRGHGTTVGVMPPSATVTGAPVPTPAATRGPAGEMLSRPGRGPLFAYAVPGPEPDDVVLIETFRSEIGYLGHLIVWFENERAKAQLFQLAGDSAITYGVQEVRDNQRELAVVYDATAYGSGSPTAGVALLRLEDGVWRVLWDSGRDGEGWQGYHGVVEFIDGGIEALEVRGDIWGDVLAEANAGPHQQFIDRWERDGDRYVRVSAETVPSAYATLVEFLRALGSGDEAAAGRLVTDAAIVDRARSLGLDGALGKNWGIQCDDWSSCLHTGPIGFDSLRTRGEPAAEVFFVEENGRWLVDDIRETESP